MGRTFEAFETGDAVLLVVVFRSPFRDSSHRTLLHTLLTVSTIISDGSFENPETGKNREKSSKGAEITTPEPLPDHSEGQYADEKDEDEEIDLKDGQRNARHNEGVLRKKTLNLWKEMVEDKEGGRIEGGDR